MGVATLIVSSLSVTTHSISAQYGGDSGYQGSTSSTLSQVVNKDGTTATILSSLNPSVYGQSVTFTVTVAANAPGSGTPGGKVNFKDNGAIVATVTLDSHGIAAFTTSTLKAGSQNMV